jgi:uncharacterized membrane protein
MSVVEKSIEVNVPLSMVYNQWTQFEDLPKFMEGVKAIRQIDDTHLIWKAEIMGIERQWLGEISEQVPDQRIAWHSIEGVKNAGVVTFHYLSPEKTRVTLQMEFAPEGVVETVSDMLGLVTARVQGDLERFKAFIESRKEPTGAWRKEW